MDKEFEKKLRKNFEQVLGGFDFSYVEKAMIFLDWKWLFPNKYSTPNKDEMIDCVQQLFEGTLDDLKHKDESWHGTGGFRVDVRKPENIRISFILEESDSFWI
jgi:hypothetical protein